jgi:hypothetical protein
MENAMKPITMFVLAAALLAMATVLPTGDTVAQRKQQTVFKVDPANAKYTQQYVINVGDVPGHQVRLFEVRRTYPSNPPVINGMKIVESWTRGVSDYIDNNGPAVVYHIFVAENGDKFFVQSSTVATQVPGTTKFTGTTVGPITGGTGNFAGIQGLVRVSISADPASGANETEVGIEYWFTR